MLSITRSCDNPAHLQLIMAHYYSAVHLHYYFVAVVNNWLSLLVKKIVSLSGCSRLNLTSESMLRAQQWKESWLSAHKIKSYMPSISKSQWLEGCTEYCYKCGRQTTQLRNILQYNVKLVEKVHWEWCAVPWNPWISIWVSSTSPWIFQVHMMISTDMDMLNIRALPQCH